MVARAPDASRAPRSVRAGRRLTRTMDDATRQVLQRVVGDEAGLPASVHTRLRGDDVAALLADARAMRSELGLPPLDKPQERDEGGKFSGGRAQINAMIRAKAGR